MFSTARPPRPWKGRGFGAKYPVLSPRRRSDFPEAAQGPCALVLYSAIRLLELWQSTNNDAIAESHPVGNVERAGGGFEAAELRAKTFERFIGCRRASRTPPTARRHHHE